MGGPLLDQLRNSRNSVVTSARCSTSSRRCWLTTSCSSVARVRTSSSSDSSSTRCALERRQAGHGGFVGRLAVASDDDRRRSLRSGPLDGGGELRLILGKLPSHFGELGQQGRRCIGRRLRRGRGGLLDGGRKLQAGVVQLGLSFAELLAHVAQLSHQRGEAITAARAIAAGQGGGLQHAQLVPRLVALGFGAFELLLEESQTARPRVPAIPRVRPAIAREAI